MKIRTLLILSVVLLPLLFGCGPRTPYPVVPFSGMITHDGKPVSGVSIIFEPETGRPSTGATDENGRFTMIYTVRLDGVQKGKGKFILEVPQMPGENATEISRLIREKYSRENTPLIVDIQKPEKDYEIKLE